jgi:H+/Cl- antiporter ClcA
MSFAPHIRRRHLLSGQRWQMRLVFWGGAVAVGLVSVAFAWAANRATELFHHLLVHPSLDFILTPGTFVLSAYLARRFFAGSQGSGIPQAIAARRARGRREALLSVRLTWERSRSHYWDWRAVPRLAARAQPCRLAQR